MVRRDKADADEKFRKVRSLQAQEVSLLRYSRIRYFTTGKEPQPSHLGNECEVRSSSRVAVRPALLDLVDLSLLD